MTEQSQISQEALDAIHRWWRAANYLSVGQIYLMGNPLLREDLAPEHIKPRLLGHWGTTPGLNFLYAHINRIITERKQETLYITGDRKSTRLNSSHVAISYAVFCL